MKVGSQFIPDSNMLVKRFIICCPSSIVFIMFLSYTVDYSSGSCGLMHAHTQPITREDMRGRDPDSIEALNIGTWTCPGEGCGFVNKRQYKVCIRTYLRDMERSVVTWSRRGNSTGEWVQTEHSPVTEPEAKHESSEPMQVGLTSQSCEVPE